MKAAEKNRQKLSSSQSKTPNAKYNIKRQKISLTSVIDYVEYMEEDSVNS